MSKRRVSVPMVVAITLVAATTLILGLFGTGTYIREEDNEWRRLRGDAKQLANQLAVGLALPVWNIDRDQIDRIVEAAGATPTVQAIVVEAAGKTHARMRTADNAFLPHSGDISPKDLVVEEVPITFDDQRIGSVRLFISPKFVKSDLRSTLSRIVLTIVALDALLVFFAYLVLWVAVLQPLTQIEKYAVAVTAGREHPELELSPSLTSDLANLRTSIEEMVKLQESLRRSETMSVMGDLVGGVAHEIRNPLFAISALVDAYADELTQYPEFRDGVREQVTRLTTLTRELLEYGRPVLATRTEAPLAGVIQDAVRSRAMPKVRVSTSIGEDLPMIPMDRDRLRQAFENLIENAIQYSPENGAVRISVKADDSWVECTVEDEGPGFKSDEIGLAFEPFYSRRPGGTGLGLSIVERIVEQHEGTVAAANRADHGAIVTVRLPISRAPRP